MALSRTTRTHDPDQRLLVGVGPMPDAEHTVRWARDLALALKCQWLAVHVAREENHPKVDRQMARALALARELGAETLSTTDDDVVRGLLRVARQRNVTHVVIGRPIAQRAWWNARTGDRTAIRLLQDSGGLQIYVAGGEETSSRETWQNRSPLRRTSRAQYVSVVGAIAAVTGVGFLLTPVVGPHATALVFLVAVVGLALVFDRGPALLAATLSALAWDYFFLPPVFAFEVHSFEDAMFLAIYFVVALALGQLTSRAQAQQLSERQREAQATALYLLTRELNQARTVGEILATAKAQFQTAFHVEAELILKEELGSEGPLIETSKAAAGGAEIVLRVFEQGRPAGNSTDQFAESDSFYMPLTNNAGVVGVVALRFNAGRKISLHEQMLAEAFSDQIAVALDRLRLGTLSEQARVLMESERLSTTLLDSMSHELRTPIAAIKGATGVLMSPGFDGSRIEKEMLTEIAKATERLHRLVSNILDFNRLQSGAVKPMVTHCDPAELVNLCVAETEELLAKHSLTVNIQPNLPMVKMDFVLTQQALINLLANAAAHTPPGTRVIVSAQMAVSSLVITVRDAGPGIDSEILPRIFDKFVRGPNARAGGTGLGLSLVKGFVEAQHGSVSVVNHPAGGALFSIRLPADAEAGAVSVSHSSSDT